MRRRILFSGGGVTLSSYSETVEPNASSISITAYANGQPITDATSSMLTKDGSKITSATINSSGVITMSYTRNTSTSYSQTGWIKFTYKEQTVQFNLTQSRDYVTSTSTSSTRTETREVITNVNYNGFGHLELMRSECISQGQPSYVTFENSTGTINTEYYHYKYTYYKSGNSTSVRVTERETQTPSTTLTAKFVSDQVYDDLVVGQTYSGTFYLGSDSVSASAKITKKIVHVGGCWTDATITHNGSIIGEFSDIYMTGCVD